MAQLGPQKIKRFKTSKVLPSFFISSQFQSDPLALYPVKVNGTINVIRAVQICGDKRLVFGSTANTLDIDGETVTPGNGISRYYRKSG